MKKKLLTFLSLGILSVFGLSLGLTHNYAPALAEDDPVATEPEQFECSVVAVNPEHGEISVDKEQGHVGEIATVTVKHDLFYLIESVSVNGTALVESQDTKGEFSFALVEGENKIEAKIVVDQQLLGEMAVVYDQARNKDWTNLFSVENVLRVVTFLLNGGILLAVARYFIKDKRLEQKVENKIGEEIEKVIPGTTKETVLATMQDVVMPFFTDLLTKLNLKVEDLGNALTVFSRCFALSLENTPESKIAITQELSSLKLSDQEAISAVRSSIEAFIKQENEKMVEIMKKMSRIEETNKQIIGSAKKEESVAEEEPVAEEASKEEKVIPYE